MIDFRTLNPLVVGSIPTRPTNQIKNLFGLSRSNKFECL